MNAAWVVALAIGLFYLGFRFYSRYLTDRIFKISLNSKTPAHTEKDGVDFSPAHPEVLFGHHFSSIAGAAPIVGPAVAVIWGWVPAVIWIVLGSLLIGAVHDLGALILSMKHKGESVGALSKRILGERVSRLFLVVIFFLNWLVISVFALVIANLFKSFPGSVVPINFEIIVALIIGYFFNRKAKSITWPSIIAFIVLYFMIYVGTLYPISLSGMFGSHEIEAWIVFLLLYAWVSSSLPVWFLLQPRDLINSHQLFIGLGALIVGLFIVQPTIVAPAFNLNPEGAPSWFPYLFLTIACGAISGFHSLVSSGTTSKQVGSWKDVRLIGYGGMLGEAMLALMATLAVTAGFLTSDHWHEHYSSWGAANGLTAKINAFIFGSSRFLSGIGLSGEFANTVIAVLVISFAATTLDTATRIQRYVVKELGSKVGLKCTENRFVSGAIAVGAVLVLVFLKESGKGGLVLWPLFGATNQMLGSLTLIVAASYLIKNKKFALPYLIPAGVMVFLTSLGLVYNLSKFISEKEWFLAGIDATLLCIQTWIVFEGVNAMIKMSKKSRSIKGKHG